MVVVKRKGCQGVCIKALKPVLRGVAALQTISQTPVFPLAFIVGNIGTQAGGLPRTHMNAVGTRREAGVVVRWEDCISRNAQVQATCVACDVAGADEDPLEVAVSDSVI